MSECVHAMTKKKQETATRIFILNQKKKKKNTNYEKAIPLTDIDACSVEVWTGQ